MPNYPSIQDPRFDINPPKAPATLYNQQQQPSSQKQNHTNAAHAQPTQNKTQKTEAQKKCQELVEIAKVAFKNGSLAVAYAAMSAAIKELETK